MPSQRYQEMHIVSLITDAQIIERILRHVGVRDQRTLPPQKD